MKAVVYQGMSSNDLGLRTYLEGVEADWRIEPFKVTIEERPLLKLKHPDDCLIKVTTAAICGSDLHMYQGRTAAQGGLCFGE